VGELPNSHGRTLTDKSYVIHGIQSAFYKAAFSPKFQKRLENLDVPFAFKDRHQLETEAPKNYQFWGELLKELGLLKK
jgi:tripartite-type tricarboxylate transporter receptor subunit TctC